MHIYQEAVAFFLAPQSMHNKFHIKHWGYTNTLSSRHCSPLQDFKINTWNYVTEDSFKQFLKQIKSFRQPGFTIYHLRIQFHILSPQPILSCIELKSYISVHY